jgi:hypothetical protein
LLTPLLRSGSIWLVVGTRPDSTSEQRFHALGSATVEINLDEQANIGARNMEIYADRRLAGSGEEPPQTAFRGDNALRLRAAKFIAARAGPTSSSPSSPAIVCSATPETLPWNCLGKTFQTRMWGRSSTPTCGGSRRCPAGASRRSSICWSLWLTRRGRACLGTSFGRRLRLRCREWHTRTAMSGSS